MYSYLKAFAYLGCNIRHKRRFRRLRSSAPQTQHCATVVSRFPSSQVEIRECEHNFPPSLFAQAIADFLRLENKPALTANRAHSTALAHYGQTVHFILWSRTSRFLLIGWRGCQSNTLPRCWTNKQSYSKQPTPWKLEEIYASTMCFFLLLCVLQLVFFSYVHSIHQCRLK